MPARYPQNSDPFRNVHAWDDGYEYTRPGAGAPRGYSPPPYSAAPPPAASRPSRAPRYETERLPRPPLGRDAGSFRKSRPASPPSAASDPYSRSRRSRRDRSPVYRGPTRSPSPPPRRREERRDRDSRYPPSSARRPPPPKRHDTAPMPRSSRRGESPPAPRRRTFSPSPPPRQRTRARSRDRDRRPRRASSPIPSADKRRPPLERSKTTAAGAAAGANKSKFPTIGPRWQAAAAAALQSGAAAAMNMRSQPGSWTGQKGARVATAALGAAAMDAFAGKKKPGGGGGAPETKAKGGPGGGLGGALGGLLVDQFVKKASKR